MAVFSLASVSAFGAHVKGMINSRTGETLTVASGNGNVIVLLTDSTATKDDTGIFGLSKDKMASTVLIPGLKIDVEGEQNGQGQFVAKTITVDGDDLETSEMIEAGVKPTAKQVAANIVAIDANRRTSTANAAEIEALKKQLAEYKQNSASHEPKISQDIQETHVVTERFMALEDFDVKNKATVKFTSGSSALSKESEEALKSLASSAVGTKGYIVEVIGHADSTGHDAMNTKLSDDRARAVVAYLIQQGGVPVRHIVAPGAMGEYGPVASNETAAGRAENRRVDVNVLVHKGPPSN
jgi:outer membrane protein OmpA-like peptidoglycan-associated protein